MKAKNNRRFIEKAVRVSIIAVGAYFSALYAHSIFNPQWGGNDVKSQIDLTLGEPKVVLSDFPNIVVNYTEASIYRADLSNFVDESKRSMIMPSAVYRFEKNEETRSSVYTLREGTEQTNPLLSEGDEYSVQFDCPSTMKSVRVSYDNIELDTRVFKEEGTEKIIVKVDFEAERGKRSLEATVEYFNGEKDIFEVAVLGQ